MQMEQRPRRATVRAALRRGIIALGALLICPGCATLRAESEVLTPEHLLKLRRVASAHISPDGRRIAYVLEVPRTPFKDEDGRPWMELHVADPQGRTRPFVTGEVSVGGVAWKPDGSAISFIDKRGKDKHRALYAIPLDGGEAQRIVQHGDDIGAYSWSPDGQRVAFVAKEPEPKTKKELKEKGFKAEIYEEDWRPAKVWIAEVGIEGAKPRALELPGTPGAVEWSPVDGRLAVTLAPSPSVDQQMMYSRLHVVDVDTGRVLAKFENPGKLGPFAWSPDGRHLALVSAADLNDPSAGRLMVVPAGGGALRELLPGDTGDVSRIAWQDNETIMFVRDEGVWMTFEEIRLDGTQRKTHIPGGRVVLRGFSLSRDGQSAAFSSDSPAHPAELFAMSHGDAGLRRLTESNPWLKDIRLAKQEPIRFQARDGVELEGILIRPLDEQPGQRYPLIVAVHGGPEAQDSNGWLTSYADPGQVAAARGFAVFYPNYRGSTGRGVEFSKLSQGDPAGREFDDLVDAVDHLVATGLVDRERVGVTGGSYGGYATAWCSTYYSERFAAGVMFVGISDRISKSGTTDIPQEEYLVHSRQQPWENWDFFLQRSPIYHADKSRTPLLILHGKEDPRVHPSQSLEMYRYLKLRGQAPVRLVWYPGEGHGNRQIAGRYDYNLRMLQWFEHYLNGPGGEPPPYELNYAKVKPPKEEEENDSREPSEMKEE